MRRDSSPPPQLVLRPPDLKSMAGTPKVHFLNANARRTNRSLGDATGLTGLGVHLIEVPAGADSTEPHVHHHEDECIYVLEGTAILTLGEAKHEIGPGTFVGFPAGGPAHALHNPGPEPLRCLVIGQRLAHDVGDYPRLGKRLYRNDGQWDLVDHSSIANPKAQRVSTAGKK